MSTENNHKRILNELFIAFNQGDLDRVMSYFADDAVFEAAAGDEACGKTIIGKQAIRAAFEGVYKNFPDIQWANASHRAVGNVGLSEWVFTGTNVNGFQIEANGVDIFSFVDGKITKKSAYRKDRPLMEMAL